MKLSPVISKYRISIAGATLVIIAVIVGFLMTRGAPEVAGPDGIDTTKQPPAPVILTPEMKKVLIEEMSVSTTVPRLSEKKIEALKNSMSVTNKTAPTIPTDELTKLLDSMSAQ